MTETKHKGSCFCGSVEIEKAARLKPSAMFHDKMTVQHNRLHLSQKGILPVQLGPAGLYHAYPLIGKAG